MMHDTWTFYVYARAHDRERIHAPVFGWLMVPLPGREPVKVRLPATLTRLLLALHQVQRADATKDKPEALKGACTHKYLGRVCAELAGVSHSVDAMSIKKYLQRIRGRIRDAVQAAQRGSKVPPLVEACEGGTGLLRLVRGLRVHCVCLPQDDEGRADP